jgi:hypothetical protein
MNHSAPSTYIKFQAAAVKQSVKRAIACVFWTVAVLMVMSHTAWADNGAACLPNGFNSFSPISPNVISAKKVLSSDAILSTQTVTVSFNNFACTIATNAELAFYFSPSSLFVSTYNNSGFIFTSTFNIIENRPRNVKIGIEFRTASPDVFSNSYAFYIKYFVNVRCSGGGLGVYLPGNGEARITGVNSAACNGNYIVTYTYEIYQNAEATLKTGYKQATNGSGFSARVRLYSGNDRIVQEETLIPGSATTVFQSNLNCNYSLSSNSLNLGSFTNHQIYRRNTVPVAFTISTTDCRNTSGGGRSHGLYVFWNFDAVDPADPGILANTSTGTNAATNVGVKISCNGGSAVAKDNVSVKLSSAISSGISFPCSAQLVPMSNVVSPEDIGPGSFTSRATLTFQFD